MDLVLTQAALESGEHGRLGDAAREVGRNLAARTEASWLEPVRRHTARSRATAKTDYERGFLDALDQMIGGFARELEDEIADAAELQVLQARTHWLPLLRAIADGTQKPGQLEDVIGVSGGRITTLLKELDEAGLIVQAVVGNTRPCRLTPRARVLLERLPAEKKDEAAKAIEEVVSGVVRCMTDLNRDSRIGQGRLIHTMRGVLTRSSPAQVFGLFEKELARSACAVKDPADDSWTATEVELLARLQQHLVMACRKEPTPLINWLGELSDRGPVIIRVGARFREWDVAIQEHALKNVAIFQEEDARRAAHDRGQQVVYECPSLLVTDHDRGLMSEAILHASGRHCLSVDGRLPVANFNPHTLALPEPRAW